MDDDHTPNHELELKHVDPADGALPSADSLVPVDAEIEVDDQDAEPAVPFAEIKAEAQRVARSMMAWSAPLPPADELEAYDKVESGFAQVIMRDFERRTDIEAEAARAEVVLQEREMALKEREQDLRVKQSDSDIATRDTAVSTGRILVLALPLLAFAAMMFGPFDDGYERVVAAAVFLSPFLVIGIVLLLRGRMSEPERDVLRDALPKIVEAIGRQPAAKSDAPQLSDPALPTGEKPENAPNA